METGISVIHNFADVQNAATAMAKSGYFQDSRDQAQAIVKILAGQELGFGPFSSMTGVYIIQGRPSIGANLMAAAVKSSEKYNYRLIENTEKAVEIAFFERDGGKWVEIGRSRFTHDDAVKAGTKNLDKFPRNMLFARAISNGVRWYCPDVFNGSPVYTPEELGADVDQEGNIIDIVATEVEKPEPEKVEPAVPLDNVAEMSLEMAMTETTSKGEKYGDLQSDKLSFMYNAIVSKKPITDDHKRKMTAIQTILQSRADSSGA
jgi:hypothetical protein